MDEQQKPRKKFPSVQEFCVALPLYAEHVVESDETRLLHGFFSA